jgi:hypothetical protein
MRWVKKMYRRGARADPWGTLASRGKALERILLIEIFPVRFLRYKEVCIMGLPQFDNFAKPTVSLTSATDYDQPASI